MCFELKLWGQERVGGSMGTSVAPVKVGGAGAKGVLKCSCGASKAMWVGGRSFKRVGSGAAGLP